MSSPYPHAHTAPSRLHRFAIFLASAIVLLIAAGALVKSKEAGLSVPDWPLSYGSLNPPNWWRIDNVRAEHGHRLFAGTIALLTVALAVWTQRVEPRRWVRRLAWAAVGAVLVQALLGGITVLLFLPPAVSISHAGLAQLFLALVVTVAVATGPEYRAMGPGYRGPESRAGAGARSLAGLRTLAATTVGAIYVQILLGALVRHSGAGLAIPDFPLVFGGLVPPHFTWPVGVHYAHRVGALAVAVLVFATAARALRLLPLTWLRRPALFMMLLVTTQIALGGAVVLTGRAVVPNTVHVATGAALLATSLVLALRSARLASLASTAAELGREAVAPRRPVVAPVVAAEAREALRESTSIEATSWEATS